MDLSLLNSIFVKYKISHVYHLAAYAAEGLSHFIRNFNYTNNLIGSVNLINQAVNHQIECFVFTSSIAVYGRNQLPFTEETEPRPEDPYGISKYAVELDLRNAREMFGLNHVIFRPHNVYGEYQNIGDRYRNVIGIFMNNILQGTEMPIFGDGTQTRAFSYISDVAIPIARSGFMPDAVNQVFNIGADRDYSINELAREIGIALNVAPNIIHLPARNEVSHAYCSHEKAKLVFGPQIANVELNVGLRRMAMWVKHVGSRTGKPFENIEVRRNLPPSWQ